MLKSPESPQSSSEDRNPQEGKTNVNEKVVTLPNREEMLANLIKVKGDPHLQENFYPILLKQAGQERVSRGIVMMLMLAIYDYTKGMPPVIANIMYMQAPDFIDALVSDPEVKKEAKSFLQQALSGTK